MSNVLLFLFLFPFIAALVFLLFPKLAKKKLAFVLSLVPLLFLLEGHLKGALGAIDVLWIAPLSIHFHLEASPLAIIFLSLTAIVIPFAIVSVRATGSLSERGLYILIFILEGLLIGFFTSEDLALFTLFYEAMLLPLYFILALAGTKKSRAAAIKFIVYMFAGSALMLGGIIALYASAGTFDLKALGTSAAASPYAIAIFFIFLLAFAVKTPLFPFHAWLVDAYSEAPTAGTILLSALLSKAGIYGILKVLLPLFPAELAAWSPWLIALAIAGVFYGGFAAYVQTDFKRLIAYSSFSHVNFILAGLFLFQAEAQSGAVVQAFNHGITIAALFLAAGFLAGRLGTTSMLGASGLMAYFPRLGYLTLFFVLSSIAVPGTNNFVGELLIFFGYFKENPYVAALLALSIILSAIYMLRFMQKVYFEAPVLNVALAQDISRKQLLAFVPLILLVLGVGLYPAPLLKLASASIVQQEP